MKFYQLVCVNESNEQQSSGKVFTGDRAKLLLDMMAEQENIKYPTYRHTVTEVDSCDDAENADDELYNAAFAHGL